MISKLVRLGPALMKLNNYNGIMEIVSALHSAPISRLKEMWAAVTPADQQQLTDLMSPSLNYKAYREAISNADTPRIPYLGCWLQDITMIEESPDKLPNGMFNLEKDLLEEFYLSIGRPYNFEAVRGICAFILKGEAWDEDTLFEVSKIKGDAGAGKGTLSRRATLRAKVSHTVFNKDGAESPKAKSKKEQIEELQARVRSLEVELKQKDGDYKGTVNSLHEEIKKLQTQVHSTGERLATAEFNAQSKGASFIPPTPDEKRELELAKKQLEEERALLQSQRDEIAQHKASLASALGGAPPPPPEGGGGPPPLLPPPGGGPPPPPLPAGGPPPPPPPPGFGGGPPPPPPPPGMGGGPPPPPPPPGMGGGPPPPPPPPGGGPPGPPPPPGMGGPPMPPGKFVSKPKPTKAKITPTQKMKGLFWKPIIIRQPAERGDDEPDTVWDGMPELDPRFDAMDFESLFATKVIEKKVEKPSEKTKTLSALDPKRSQAVSIMMAKVPDHIDRVVRDMDDAALDTDILSSIIAGLGSEEEITALKHLREGDSSTPFDKPDEFVWKMHSIPFITERLKCWEFQKQFPDRTWDLTQPLANIKSAVIEFRISEAIPAIFSLALTCGNYLNGGTARGQADGFHYQILEKLSDTRSGDNKLSLIGYIARLLCEKEPGIIKLLPSPETMEEAAKVPFSDLEGAIAGLQKSIRETKTMMQKALDSGADLGPAFVNKVPKFLTAAEKTMEAIVALYKETEDYYHQLLLFIGNTEQDAKKIKADEFFKSMTIFLRTFKKEWEVEEKLKEKRIYERLLAARAAEGKSGKAAMKTLDEAREQKQSKLKGRFAKFRQKKASTGGPAVATGVADKAAASPLSSSPAQAKKTVKRPVKKSAPSTTAASGETKTCPNCSKELPAAVGFCTGCGSKV